MCLRLRQWWKDKVLARERKRNKSCLQTRGEKEWCREHASTAASRRVNQAERIDKQYRGSVIDPQHRLRLPKLHTARISRPFPAFTTGNGATWLRASRRLPPIRYFSSIIRVLARFGFTDGAFSRCQGRRETWNLAAWENNWAKKKQFQSNKAKHDFVPRIARNSISWILISIRITACLFLFPTWSSWLEHSAIAR